MNTASEQDIRKRLLVVRLPSPPQTLLKLLTLCQSDDAGMAELSELVAADPAMTVKIMAVAHSAAYHREGAPQLTLLQATSRLGTALIKVLVISESVLQTFNEFRQVVAVDLRSFWKHSLTVAVVARELAQRLGNAPTEESYLAGLLHDVGRLALLVAAPDDYAPIFAGSDDDTLCDRERQALGMSHAEAGTWLLEKWHLSAAVFESVGLHHTDIAGLAEVSPLTRVLHLAHRLAGLPMNEIREAANLDFDQVLPKDDMVAIVQQTTLRVEQIARDLGLDISTTPLPPVTLSAGLRQSGADTVQSQLTKDVLDRSVFNEMAMTLVHENSAKAALLALRYHASALLQLEDSVVMLLRDSPQVLVPVAFDNTRRKAGPLSFGVSTHAPMTECVTQRKVVFAGRNGAAPKDLLDFMAAQEVVLIPLVTSQNCLGVLVATVPADISEHLKKQVNMMQAFGVYAGLALARRHQADKQRAAQIALARQEGRLEIIKISHEVSKFIDRFSDVAPFGPVDLCLCVTEMLQLLQDSQLVPDNVIIRSDMAGRAALVQGSPHLVKQIVHILVKNACAAMPEGGHIAVDAGALVQRNGAMFAQLSISDSAASSNEVIKAQLYESIHTGQDSDRQTQSLGIVSHLVDKMGGNIKFSASPEGTRFDILLPCALVAPADSQRQQISSQF